MTRVEAETDWRVWGSAGTSLGPMLPGVVLGQLVLIKLGKFVRHGSTQAGRQRHQLVLLSFCQALSEREKRPSGVSPKQILQNKTRPFMGLNESTK